MYRFRLARVAFATARILDFSSALSGRLSLNSTLNSFLFEEPLRKLDESSAMVRINAFMSRHHKERRATHGARTDSTPFANTPMPATCGAGDEVRGRRG